MINSRTVILAGHVARTGETRSAYKFCSENVAEIGYLEEWMGG
jgi:hypothetical protein